MIAVYTPLNGKPEAILDMFIRFTNKLLSREQLEFIPVVTGSEDPVIIWDKPEEFSRYRRLNGSIFIPFSPAAHHLFFMNQPLNRSAIQNYRFKDNEFPALFPVNRDQAQLASVSENQVIFHADIISQLFVLLSGWEERFGPVDSLGRRTFSGSFIEYLKLIDRPLAEETVSTLLHALHTMNIPESFTFHEGYSWRLRITHDIDHLFRRTPGFFIRSILLSLGGKKPSINEIFGEFLAGNGQPDPYLQALESLIDDSETNSHHPLFFLRSGGKDKRDSKLPFKHPVFARLNQASENGTVAIGLHPGILSATVEEVFNDGWQKLQSALPASKKLNRQHFLVFDPDKTPAILDDFGFECDFTLGFHDQSGFRRATVHPFPGFRFDTWKVTGTWFIPLIGMDTTWYEYAGQTPEDALAGMLRLLKIVREWQGDVSLLFHNTCSPSFEPEKWQVYQSVLEEGKKKHALLKAFN